MTNFTTPQGSTPKDQNTGKPAGGYKSKLDEILAKAGNNNPIAAAQNKTLQQASAAAAQPATPAAPAPAQAQPANPNDRLQQILAMAGQTPAQRAQFQAQQAKSNTQASNTAMINTYLQALAANPEKLLKCEDIEFPGNPGVTDDLYFKCYALPNGSVYWDVFGHDISYVIPSSLSGYSLYDDYYRLIPDATLKNELLSASMNAYAVI